MSNSIYLPSGAPAVPVATPSRATPPGADTTGSAASHSAFQQAVERGFDGWFQAPTARHTIATPAHAPVGVAWSPARIGLHVDAADAIGRASDAVGGVGPHGHAGAPAGASRPATSPPAADATGAGSAAPSMAPLAAPLAVALAVTMAPAPADPRDLALASTLAALGSIEVVLVPAGGVDEPPPGGAGVARAAASVAPGEERAAQAAPEPPADEPAARTRPDKPAGEREPLRVHAQWSDDGVRLWLGADVDGLGAVSAVMTQLEQALAGQGARLLRVVCNGRDISGAMPSRAGAGTFDAQAAFEPRSPHASRISRL